MHEAGAQGWCTGITLRDGMGREWEGGSGWGTHVHPWLIYLNVWQKPLQYCKVISLQLKETKNRILAHKGPLSFQSLLCLPVQQRH